MRYSRDSKGRLAAIPWHQTPVGKLLITIGAAILMACCVALSCEVMPVTACANYNCEVTHVKFFDWLFGVEPTPVDADPLGRPKAKTMPQKALCACGRTAKNGGTMCGPCSAGKRENSPLGGQPVGGA